MKHAHDVLLPSIIFFPRICMDTNLWRTTTNVVSNFRTSNSSIYFNVCVTTRATELKRSLINFNWKRFVIVYFELCNNSIFEIKKNCMTSYLKIVLIWLFKLQSRIAIDRIITSTIWSGQIVNDFFHVYYCL